jgi:hypothetical protein
LIARNLAIREIKSLFRSVAKRKMINSIIRKVKVKNIDKKILTMKDFIISILTITFLCSNINAQTQPDTLRQPEKDTVTIYEYYYCYAYEEGGKSIYSDVFEVIQDSIGNRPFVEERWEKMVKQDLKYDDYKFGVVGPFTTAEFAERDKQKSTDKYKNKKKDVEFTYKQDIKQLKIDDYNQKHGIASDGIVNEKEKDKQGDKNTQDVKEDENIQITEPAEDDIIIEENTESGGN